MFDLQDCLAASFVVLAGLSMYLGVRITRERNYLRKRLAAEKAGSEILLKELHRVTKTDNETLRLFREDLAEFTVERDVALARAGSLERRLSEEIEIRLGFQNRVARAEEEREQRRGLLSVCSSELRALEERLRSMEYCAPRRDANGRFQKRTAC